MRDTWRLSLNVQIDITNDLLVGDDVARILCSSEDDDCQVYIKYDMSPIVQLRVILMLNGNARTLLFSSTSLASSDIVFS